MFWSDCLLSYDHTYISPDMSLVRGWYNLAMDCYC